MAGPVDKSKMIGQPMPRFDGKRLVSGGGCYLDDVNLPRQLHAAFLRSPFPHARIGAIGTAAAKALPGVAAVLCWRDIEGVCSPFQCVTKGAPGLVSPPQYPLVASEATYQGEPVVLVVASSRAIAEDAVDLVEVDWSELPAVGTLDTALEVDARVHAHLPSNLAWHTDINSGFVAALDDAPLTIVRNFRFGRHTGVTLEPRGVLAHWADDTGALLVHSSHQMPHQLQLHLAELMSIPLHNVRVVCNDVGGGFGIKMHVYQDDLAICAATRLLGRPVKYIADRIEGLASDIHAREALATAKIAVDDKGMLVGFDVAHRHGIGACSVFPRSSTAEALSAVRSIGGPYRFSAFRCGVDVVMQNKTMTGQYRAVGAPIGITITERLIDLAAHARNDDPLEFRLRNILPLDEMPWTNPTGARMYELSHRACIEKLKGIIAAEGIAAQIAARRAKGGLVGLGYAAFVEMTATGSEGYGRADVPVAAVDTVTLSLGAQGEVRAAASISEIGQGIRQGLRQIIADAVGVPIDRVTVSSGDTSTAPHGGGAWASRGAAIGGEAAWHAGLLLKAEMLKIAAAMLQTKADDLDIKNGVVCDGDGRERIALSDIARTVLFKGHDLPAGINAQLTVSHQYRRERDTFIPTNGIQASLIEIDRGTGLIAALRHWVVEDCGRVINPLLVDEQIRGGVVQGIGEALFEHCRYDEAGQFVSGSLADYLVPMASEMPDIVIDHVQTPYSGSDVGAKGAGEAGTCAAAAAVVGAINDALRGHGGEINAIPVTPVDILTALGTVRPL
ncbi:MAG TPA: xanthine dehydrogenase family protein molybdopterin-binding subunit [Pseudolabrys sp.]|nr:xanthine dehydrogenase family protein molybdopterin-binding subunit [Pseudolabrys sp.]